MKDEGALHIKSVQSLNRRLKGWKAEEKPTHCLWPFQPFSLPAFFNNMGSTLGAKPDEG
jgi:hypothetical protein